MDDDNAEYVLAQINEDMRKRIAKLEDERDIFKRTLHKRDARITEIEAQLRRMAVIKADAAEARVRIAKLEAALKEAENRAALHSSLEIQAQEKDDD